MAVFDTNRDTTTHIDCLKANDATTIIRYYNRDGTPKVIKKREADAILAAGLSLMIVHQRGGRDPNEQPGYWEGRCEPWPGLRRLRHRPAERQRHLLRRGLRYLETRHQCSRHPLLRGHQRGDEPIRRPADLSHRSVRLGTDVQDASGFGPGQADRAVPVHRVPRHPGVQRLTALEPASAPAQVPVRHFG